MDGTANARSPSKTLRGQSTVVSLPPSADRLCLLAIGLSYARPYKPQRKGKIERFFRTVRSQLLPEVPDGISLQEINRLFALYLEQRYHLRIHGGTGQQPPERYLQDAKALRKAPENLPEYFRKREVRVVNRDRSVKLNGRLFEAPSGLIGQKVVLRFENYHRIEVFSDEVSRGFLRKIDLAINSRVKRDSSDGASFARLAGSLFETLRQKEER